MATQKRRRRKNSGKYTPLVWVFTGALIAFFISFSNSGSMKNLLSQKYTSGRSTSKQASFSSTRVSLLTLKSNFFQNNVSSASTSYKPQDAASSPQPLFVFLAKKTPGSLKIIQKTISIQVDQSPLKDILTALISTTPGEDEYNLVPYQTKINKIWIRNEVAYIDFNDAFNYNSYGFAGYQIQLYQVVYTATQFPTVKAVYFYLNGKPLKAIGGEGFLINNPVYPYSSLPSFSTE